MRLAFIAIAAALLGASAQPREHLDRDGRLLLNDAPAGYAYYVVVMSDGSKPPFPCAEIILTLSGRDGFQDQFALEDERKEIPKTCAQLRAVPAGLPIEVAGRAPGYVAHPATAGIGRPPLPSAIDWHNPLRYPPATILDFGPASAEMRILQLDPEAAGPPR